MGEIAEDMVCGLACSACGIYFRSQHGFPVYCRDCWKGTPAKGRPSDVQRATEPELTA